MPSRQVEQTFRATPKRPRDVNARAHQIVMESVGLLPKQAAEPAGLTPFQDRASKGGQGRAKRLTLGRRREIAQKAAKVRWGKD